MNKQEFIKKVADHAEMSQKQAAIALESVLAGITDTLKSGEKVSFIGFGAFSVSEREKRKGRNPKTGKEMTIPAHRAPVFKASKKFKDEVK